MRRLRNAPKTPLAVAGILATPLFFVALMAFSLVLDKPSVELTKRGAEILADPARSTVAAIYLLSIGVSALVVLIGVLALLLPVRAAVFVSPSARSESRSRCFFRSTRRRRSTRRAIPTGSISFR